MDLHHCKCGVVISAYGKTGKCAPCFNADRTADREALEIAISETLKAGATVQEAAFKHGVTAYRVRRAQNLFALHTVPTRRMSDIITIASRLTGETESWIIDKGRTKPACAIRAGIYIVAHERGYSYPSIGERMGGRDHASIISGCRFVPGYRLAFAHFDQYVDALRRFTDDLPPFVDETAWQPAECFRFRAGQIAPVAPVVAAPRAQVMAAQAPKPPVIWHGRPCEVDIVADAVAARVVRDRNDFAIVTERGYRATARAMILGSQNLAAAINKALAA